MLSLGSASSGVPVAVKCPRALFAGRAGSGRRRFVLPLSSRATGLTRRRRSVVRSSRFVLQRFCASCGYRRQNLACFPDATGRRAGAARAKRTIAAFVPVACRLRVTSRRMCLHLPRAAGRGGR